MVVVDVPKSRAGSQIQVIRTIPVAMLGMNLSLFLALSFVLYIFGYLVLPDLPVKREALSIFLPGSKVLTSRAS